MPALCRPVGEGGLGFDYRLSMGVPDLWETMVQKKVPAARAGSAGLTPLPLQDEDWDMGKMAWVLTNHRYGEPVVTYAESHDQAIVGYPSLPRRRRCALGMLSAGPDPRRWPSG
jgi:1,4-alpha-glucan branching enzyme